jgi:hypothetical protein
MCAVQVYDEKLPVGERMKGKNVCVINRSEVVGRPLAAMLANDGADVYSIDISSTYLMKRGKMIEVRESTSCSEAVCMLLCDVLTLLLVPVHTYIDLLAYMPTVVWLGKIPWRISQEPRPERYIHISAGGGVAGRTCKESSHHYHRSSYERLQVWNTLLVHCSRPGSVIAQLSCPP